MFPQLPAPAFRGPKTDLAVAREVAQPSPDLPMHQPIQRLGLDQLAREQRTPAPGHHRSPDESAASGTETVWEPFSGFRPALPQEFTTSVEPTNTILPLQRMFPWGDRPTSVPTARSRTALQAAQQSETLPADPVQLFEPRFVSRTLPPSPDQSVSAAMSPSGEADLVSSPPFPETPLGSSVVAVQRDVPTDAVGTPERPAADPTPAAVASSSPGTPGGPAGGADLEDLARRLFDPLAALFREELWLNRERAGLTADLRR